MNRQEIYNKVRDHLLTQMQKSEETAVGDGLFESTCAYRGPNGLKCAIGILIPDDKYDPDFEGNAITERVLKAIGIESRNHLDMALLRQLQWIHDGSPPDEWKAKLYDLADYFNLER